MTHIDLGNSYATTGDRLSKSKTSNGKTTWRLVSWSQRRCEICQRFLTKAQMKYCARCKDEVHKEQKDEYFRSNSSEMKLRGLVYRNADRFNVGDVF